MRILYIAPLPPPINGHSVASKLLHDYLQESHEVKVINLGNQHLHQGRLNRWRMLDVARVLKQIARERWSADLVYFTIGESVPGNIKDLLAYLLLIGMLGRTYIHLHGGTLRTHLFEQHKILARINRALIRRMAGAIVTGPSHVKIFDGILPPEKIHVAMNFAQDYLFASEESITRKFAELRPFRFLFMSNLVEDKGYKEVVDAFLQLPPEVRQNARLDLAGAFRSAPDQAQFEAKIAPVKEIEFHGLVQGNTKRDLLAQAHALCLPTSFLEGQPLSILEAYAAGCVVLTTLRGGIPDVFADRKNGFAIKERSVTATREAMEVALEQGSDLLGVALNNRRTAEWKYREADFVRNVGSIMESTAGRLPRAHARTEVGRNTAMSVYQICTNCVMDTSDSKIVFDENGVCDHCHNFFQSTLPRWKAAIEDTAGMERLVERIRKAGKGHDFDCILGMSGGIDSSYLLYLVKEKMQLRPLVFHVDAGWNSQEAVNNIERMVDKLGLDLYTEVIDWEEMRDLQLSFFKAGVPHLDVPQDHAFFATMYNYAAKYDIKYILTGTNYSTECVKNPVEWMYFQTDLRQIKDIHRKFGTRKLHKFPFSNILRHKLFLRYIRGIRVEKPLNMFHYNKKDAEELLKREFGWQPYPEKHFESRFTRFYEGYWLPAKFGYDTRRVNLSSLILTEQMTREEALEQLEKPRYDPETLERDFEFIATKLGISVDQLRGYFNAPNKTYRDYKTQKTVFAVGAWGMRALGIETAIKR